MLAARRVDVADLNGRARTLMAAAGRLSGPVLRVDLDDDPSHPALGPAGTRSFAVGDQVIARANHYPAGILNGQTGRVVATHSEVGSLVVRIGGRGVPLDAGYLTTGGLDHGYALTIHQAQGLTTGAALLLGGDHLYREAGYVALSRGRDHNATYLAERPDNLTDLAETTHTPQRPDPDAYDPHVALVLAIEASRRQTMAIDLLAPARHTARDR